MLFPRFASHMLCLGLALGTGYAIGQHAPERRDAAPVSDREDFAITPVSGQASAPPSDDVRAQLPSPLHAVTERPISRALHAAVGIRAGRSYGAGVLVSPQGHVLTVNHVLEPGTVPRVSVAGEAWQSAKVVSTDIAADLALLQIDAIPPAARPASLGSVTRCAPGDRVFTIGSPANMNFSVAQGGLAFVGRRFGRFRYLQTDLPIHPGNSGGPLFDEGGHVIGLMTFVLRHGPDLGFAIPIDYALSRLAGLERPSSSVFDSWARARNEALF